MKTKYKFIHFEEVDATHPRWNPRHWRCVNNKHKSNLGKVEWFPQWGIFCFFPEYGMVFSKDCLEDICDFIKQLNKMRGKEVNDEKDKT